MMAFFNSAVGVMQTLVVALGASCLLTYCYFIPILDVVT
jgi:hypothetical protein